MSEIERMAIQLVTEQEKMRAKETYEFVEQWELDRAYERVEQSYKSLKKAVDESNGQRHNQALHPTAAGGG